MLLDRRAKKRDTLRTIAEYKLLRSPKKGKLKALAGPVDVSLIDISINGCAIDSPYMIPIGAILSVKIDPLAFAIEASERRKDPLKMHGKVTSSIPRSPGHCRLGVCFTSIKNKDRNLIKRFIKTKERRRFRRWTLP
ncbi:MAG: PilZ domain-containing protein [Candidatus Omnitrophica bacterium]|nr:PilZ domain-containing protein [Candidatus Omnitrophota bacterium]